MRTSIIKVIAATFTIACTSAFAQNFLTPDQALAKGNWNQSGVSNTSRWYIDQNIEEDGRGVVKTYAFSLNTIKNVRRGPSPFHINCITKEFFSPTVMSNGDVSNTDWKVAKQDSIIEDHVTKMCGRPVSTANGLSYKWLFSFVEPWATDKKQATADIYYAADAVRMKGGVNKVYLIQALICTIDNKCLDRPSDRLHKHYVVEVDCTQNRIRFSEYATFDKVEAPKEEKTWIYNDPEKFTDLYFQRICRNSRLVALPALSTFKDSAPTNASPQPPVPIEALVPPTTQAVAPPTTDRLSLDVSKKKCADLGFKPSTEGFGKCVLQLSK